MIFFLAHYFVSPRFNCERLRVKASAKLAVSLLICTVSLRSLSKLESTASLEWPFFFYLAVETALDTALFGILLSTNYEKRRSL